MPHSMRGEQADAEPTIQAQSDQAGAKSVMTFATAQTRPHTSRNGAKRAYRRERQHLIPAAGDHVEGLDGLILETFMESLRYSGPAGTVPSWQERRRSNLQQTVDNGQQSERDRAHKEPENRDGHTSRPEEHGTSSQRQPHREEMHSDNQESPQPARNRRCVGRQARKDDPEKQQFKRHGEAHRHDMAGGWTAQRENAAAQDQCHEPEDPRRSRRPEYSWERLRPTRHRSRRRIRCT